MKDEEDNDLFFYEVLDNGSNKSKLEQEEEPSLLYFIIGAMAVFVVVFSLPWLLAGGFFIAIQ